MSATAAPPPEAAAPVARRRAPVALLAGPAARTTALLGLLVVLLAACAASLAVGSLDIPLREVAAALLDHDGSDAHAIVTDLRVPRTIVAVCVGLALGAAGALMQGITRNPLAEPGILGINQGASLAVVLAIFVLGITSPAAYVWFALLGGLASAVAVYALGASGRDGATPIKLAIAGMVIASLLASLTYAVLVLDLETLDKFRLWVVGSVAGRSLEVLTGTLPVLGLGALIALGAGRRLNALALGDDLAHALGERVALVRGVVGLGAVALAAGAVGVAGPIAFVGLITPHVARGLVGPDYRWVIPYAAVLGAILLVAADVLGRVIARPGEVEVGILCAVLGAPVFIAMVRRRKLAEL